MRVVVVKKFRDKYTGNICKPGQELDMTQERVEEIQKNPVTYIQILEKEMCEVAQIDRKQLESMKYQDLKALAKDMGLSDKGTKEQLVDRIHAKKVGIEE